MSVLNVLNGDEKEVSKKIGGIVREGGLKFQTSIMEDIKGVVYGYSDLGYTVLSETEIGKSGHKIKNEPYYESLLTHSVWGDIDIFIINNKVQKVVAVISSKATICDDHFYASMFFAESFKNKGIPFYIITKDTKSILKSGKSKYIKMLHSLGWASVYVNNNDNYSDMEKHSWTEYAFDKYIQPYYNFTKDINDIIEKFEEENGDIIHPNSLWNFTEDKR